MDWFDRAGVAAGYARYRPRFHAQVLDRAAGALGWPATLGRVLDIGCGAGLSAQALTTRARCVVGLDRAADMLRAAAVGPGRRYVVAAGECPPFRAATFDAITVSGVLSWLDRDLFLRAAHELLNDDGWLLVYDGGDLGGMVEDPAFARWHTGTYGARLPRPPRDERPVDAGQARAHSFDLVLDDSYVLELPFTQAAYTGFVLTESRVTTAVDGGDDLQAIRAWLDASLQPFFAPATTEPGTAQTVRHLRFGGPLWGLRRR